LPAKFAIGLLLLAVGFLVMAGAAVLVASGNKVLPTWLIATYLFHSLGNLIAGLAAGRLTSEDPTKMPLLFLVMVGAATLVGLVVLGLTKPIKRLMVGVE
jgi:POT family proton-dependent oligopeptide transporter